MLRLNVSNCWRKGQVSLGLSLCLAGASACGDSGGGTSDGAATTVTTTSATSATAGATATTGASATAGATAGATTAGATTAGATTAGVTSEAGGSSSSGAPETTSSTGAGETAETTGQVLPPCDPIAIPDTENFVFVKNIEIGVDTLQAGYYDNNRQEVTVLSFYGDGKVLDIDGNILRDAAAPPEALPQLDGAAYDTAGDVALLINQSCVLVEADPETMTALSVTQLDYGMSVCAGLAIDQQGDLYIASHGTRELVVLTRDTQTLITRVELPDYVCFDGIAEIAGSDNFIVNDTTLREAMIVGPEGDVIVPSAAIGMAPLTGVGQIGQPDSMLTICDNGHSWVCDAYGTVCSDFSPEGGDKAACGCLIPE